MGARLTKDELAHRFNEIKRLATKKGGKVLTQSISRMKDQVLVECIQGHQWKSDYDHLVKRVSWCKSCAGKSTKTIEEMHEFAKKYGSECLEISYKNNETNMRWKCKNGHVIFSSYKDLQKNIRRRKNDTQNLPCCECDGRRRYTIEDLHKLAEERNGKCLSKEYKSYKEKIWWQCVDNHKWQACFEPTRRGSWCPTCAKIKYRTEQKVRICFESFLGEKLPNIRGVIKNSETGKKLELDGYCEKLKIAFEYQGEHHYKKTDYSKTPLLIIQKRDIYKQEACKKLGIKLYVIENLKLYYQNNIDQLINDIRQKCLNIDSEITNISNEVLKEKFNQYEGALKEMQDYAEARGGRVNSDVYVNAQSKLSFTCKNGHTWDATPNNIKSKNVWCKICAGLSNKTIEEMKEFATKRGGYFVSETYINNKYKHKWGCNCGHTWEESYTNMLRRKNWCNKCNPRMGWQNERTIQDMIKFAKDNNGECLSTEYKNNRTKLQWSCKNGHIFNESYETMNRRISRNYWCLQCKQHDKKVHIR
jgi:hypothetical protein